MLRMRLSRFLVRWHGMGGTRGMMSELQSFFFPIPFTHGPTRVSHITTLHLGGAEFNALSGTITWLQ